MVFCHTSSQKTASFCRTASCSPLQQRPSCYSPRLGASIWWTWLAPTAQALPTASPASNGSLSLLALVKTPSVGLWRRVCLCDRTGLSTWLHMCVCVCGWVRAPAGGCLCVCVYVWVDAPLQSSIAGSELHDLCSRLPHSHVFYVCVVLCVCVPSST